MDDNSNRLDYFRHVPRCITPREVVESAMHYRSNEGIHDGDANLSIYRYKGAARFKMLLRVRNRKGRRGKVT
jgi:hypothetical protein